jgi:hypothetical protein
MADLCPEASNAFKMPLFEIRIFKDKNSPLYISRLVALEVFVTHSHKTAR